MTSTHLEDLPSPAERRRQKVREAILDAAERVFADEGEAGLSIRRLAEEVDYSPAAIYKYFGSKQELVSELKEAFFEQILAAMDAREDHDGPFRERAIESVLIYLRTALAQPNHYTAAFSGVSDMEKPPSDRSGPPKKIEAFSRLKDMVADGVALGAFRADLDVSLAAKSVWAASHGLIALMAHMPDFPTRIPDESETTREVFMRYHAEQIVRGLMK